MEITNNVAETIKTLEKEMTNIFNDTNYKKFLSLMSNFNNYSLNNLQLILIQKPDATNVASFETWKKAGRYVKKGETGIRIIFPIKYLKNKKNEENEETKEATNIYFKVGSVFDISQTEVAKGKEDLLKKYKPKILDNNDPAFVEYIELFKSISQFPIYFDDFNNTKANGYCDFGTDEIHIKNSLPAAQQLKTIIHEVAHSMLHKDSDLSKELKEIEAESVAFVVSNNIGLDSSEYSFGYLASWSKEKDIKELKPLLERIHKTATNILKNIKSAQTKEKEVLAG